MIIRRTLGFSLLALLAATACRPREGERCICAGECAGGLVCAADGAVLRDGQCVSSVSNDLESGICVDGGNVDLDDDALTPPPKFDAGSWATSGEVPVTTADGGETTTMPEETSSSSSGDASSSSSSSDSSSSSGTTAGSTDTGSTADTGSDGSGDTGASSSGTTAGG